MNPHRILKLGTRGSILARRQAVMVQEEIQHHFPDLHTEITIIKTTGDKIQDHPLADLGGKGLFTKEIDQKLLNGDIDLAIHSMKDVETFRSEGLDIFAFLKRNDPRDVLISYAYKSFDALPQGAKIGTCSPRRQAQILSLRPDLNIVMMRGNVDTRLTKLASGACDALILAYAGLERLQRTHLITQIFDPLIMTPAVAQGVIGMEIRQEDEDLKKILSVINHEETARCIYIERQFLKGFEGDCHTAIAGWAQETGKDDINFQAMILTAEGETFLKKQERGTFEQLSCKAFTLGQEFKRWHQIHQKKR